MNRRTMVPLLMTLFLTALSTRADAYQWAGPDNGSWTTGSNWAPTLTDPLNVAGPIDLVASSTALNRCILSAPSSTANVSNTITVLGDAGATFDNQRLFIQDATTLASADYLLVLERGMVIAEGGSTVRAPLELLVDGAGAGGSLFLRSSTAQTAILENWGRVRGEFTSVFEHPTPSNPIDFRNLFPGDFKVECGANVTVDGTLFNEGLGNQKAVVSVGDGATLTVTGTFTNNGTLTVGTDCSPTQVAHLILFGAAMGGPTAEFHVRSNGVVQCASFDCATVDSTYGPDPTGGVGILDLTDGEIRILDPVGGAVSTVELVSEDVGTDVMLEGPAAPPGTIGVLRLGPSPSPIQLVDDRDNTHTGTPEAIYVRDLILEDGITLDLNGAKVYYGTVTPEDPRAPGSGVTIIGSGSLTQVNPVTAAVNTLSATRDAELTLQGAAPNPFRPRTSIRFTTARSAHVRLSVYDLAGRVVRRLVDGTVPAGEHHVEWNGRSDAGRTVAGGVYFCTLEGLGERKTTRITALQ